MDFSFKTGTNSNRQLHVDLVLKLKNNIRTIMQSARYCKILFVLGRYHKAKVLLPPTHCRSHSRSTTYTFNTCAYPIYTANIIFHKHNIETMPCHSRLYGCQHLRLLENTHGTKHLGRNVSSVSSFSLLRIL